MGRTRQRHNWKARQQQTKQDSLASKSEPVIKLDLDLDQSKYDSCNALVVDDKKKRVKPKLQILQKKKQKIVLSNKRRKKLEKVLARKQKKENRTQLLSDLEKCQIDSTVYDKLTSACALQTKGRKRIFIDAISETKPDEVLSPEKVFRKTKKRLQNKPKHLKTCKVSNTIGFDEKSSEDDICENAEDLDLTNKSPKESQNTIDEKGKVDSTVGTVDNTSKLRKEEKIKAKSKEQFGTEYNSELNDATKSTFVLVNRTLEIEKSRSKLPIINEEQNIMEKIKNNLFVILCGETGSGKTTQVPQFLYEAGFTNNGQIIGITEPRRIAAIAMSERVDKEMNLTPKEVSYQIRFEGNVTRETKIKFMTDGVLLKEIQNDFLLNQYSVIIIDEAHERSIYSDILIGLLSRIVPLRMKKQNPLKCIIMSATLRIEDFTKNKNLFKITPPVIKIESRQFPVATHFNKKTPENYLDEAYKKVCKIHKEYPSGGILVFVTGQREVNILCKKLQMKFSTNYSKRNFKIAQKSDATKIQPTENLKKKAKIMKDLMPQINLDDYVINPIEEEQELIENNSFSDEEYDEFSDFEEEEEEEMIQINNQVNSQLHCLPLYSMLPKAKQEEVFKDPPKGTRLCVITTNVAETSLTIPHIRYVVDSGKVKRRVYDHTTGISTFVITWTSKASAEQRAGRAGRTGPGHCFRLYSSAVFNDSFVQFSEPEILQKPVDDLLLQMKAMNIENVVNFPFPFQPSKESLLASEKRLLQMGALNDKTQSLRYKQLLKSQFRSQITTLGKAMSCFPICPRFAKMLVLSKQYALLSLVIAIVSALTVKQVFISSHDEVNSSEDHSQYVAEKKQQCLLKKQKWIKGEQSLLLGDVMALLTAVGASEFDGCTPKFCERNCLRHKSMVEIHKLRLQLTKEVNDVIRDANLSVSPDMQPPDEMQAKLIRQIVLCGFFDHVARKVSESEIEDANKKQLKNAYQSIEVEDFVFISPDSVLSQQPPEYVVYQEIFESSKLYMRVVSAIDACWLPVYVPSFCTFSSPLENPPPRYDSATDCIKCHRTSTFGPYSWPLPPVEVDYPQGTQRFKLFAKFFLEGVVFTSLKKYASSLLSPPIIILKSWANLQLRIDKLLTALVNEDIDNKQALVSKWLSDSKYLLDEYLEWLPKSFHQTVSLNWPPK